MRSRSTALLGAVAVCLAVANFSPHGPVRALMTTAAFLVAVAAVLSARERG